MKLNWRRLRAINLSKSVPRLRKTEISKEVATPTAEIQPGKLQKVLADLRVATLPIQDAVRKRLIEVVKGNLGAFAASSTDFGRTSAVMHTIKTGEAQPFRHKLRPISFARRQFLEQEVEKLLAIGAISVADPGECPYASRTVVAPKKDGSMRMCVDYRDVNAQTVKDAFPLPRIDQVWPLLAKAKFFASLDLLMGYHQVVMDPKDRAKTAFLTHRGLFIYNVMPFGLCNAPATFQRLMEKILGSLVGSGVLVYLDDILIYAETPERLLDTLVEVLKRLASAGLKCKPSKCSLFTDKVSYLGHIVSQNGLNADPSKLETIRLWPKPEKGKGLASFLGLCNYYRELIPSFAHVSDPLYKASRQEFIEWTPQLTASFEELKRQLLEPRIVRMPDPQRDFILETDASRVALGAVLKQKFDDTNLEHPVGFFSRSLTGSERNYVAYELEMYAVVRAVEHFRVFLLGKEFLLRTDHAALRNLLKRDLPPTTRVERWILRLSEYTFKIEHQKGQDNIIADVLSRLPFASAQESTSVVGNSGSTSATSANSNLGSTAKTGSTSALQTSADSNLDVSEKTGGTSATKTSAGANLVSLTFVLSESNESNIEDNSEFDEESTDESVSDLDCEDEREFGAESCNLLATSATPIIDLPISREGLEPEDFVIPTREEFAAEQKADAELKQLRRWLDAKQRPSADELAALSGRMKSLAQLFDQISVRDQVLVIKRDDDPERELTLVPSAKVEHIIRFYHEGPGGAHQAAKATSAKVIRCFWWPDLKRDVRLYIACCPICEKFLKLKRTPRAELRFMDVGGRGDCLAMDIVGGLDSFPLTPRGHRYILTMIDCFTRYGIAVPLIDQSAEVVIASVIHHYITVYGTPRRILTDQGRNFESDQFAKFCLLFRISKIRTTAYHPQSNGICERFNQTLKNSLAKILSKDQQNSWDLYLNFAVFSYNLSIHSSTGFTPFFLTFGTEARLPPDIIFGSPVSTSSNLDSTRKTKDGSISFLFDSFSLLSGAFAQVRENLKSFHQREKDRYDLGAIERVFHAGDRVRVRIKSRQKGHAKFLSEWSEPHEVLNVRGVVVTVRELSSGREYRTHHDRLSNPLFSGRKGVEVHRHEQNANPIENPAEPEDESELAGVPEEPLTQTRSGRTIRPRRDPNYDYEFMFSELKSTCTSARSNTCFSTSASTRTSTKVCTSSVRTSVNYSSLSTLACSMSYVYSRSLLCLTNATATLALRPRANLESLPLLQESMIRDQRQQMRNLGERTSWMQEADGTQKLVMMLKRNGTLFQLDTDRGEWVTLLDQATLKEVLDEEQWAEPTGQRTLLDEEVALPPFFKDLPGFDSGAHKWPRYGLQKPWRDLVAARMERRKITLPPLFGLAANPDVAAAAANLGGTAAAVPVFAVPMMSVSEMLSPTNVKTVSTTWATAPRMTTTAQAVNLDESTSIAQLSQVESVRLASASSASEASASQTTSSSGGGVDIYRTNRDACPNLDDCSLEPNLDDSDSSQTAIATAV